MSKTPPSLPAVPVLGNILELRKAPLAFMINAARRHGDVVRYRLAQLDFYLVTHPEGVRHILQDHYRNYTRSGSVIWDALKPVFGRANYDDFMALARYWSLPPLLGLRRRVQPHRRLDRAGRQAAAAHKGTGSASGGLVGGGAMGLVADWEAVRDAVEAMKTALADAKYPAAFSTVVVFLFAILELVNRRGFHEGFPYTLFGFLWLLPVASGLALTASARRARTGNRTLIDSAVATIGTAISILTAWLWVSLLVDQMPCFLGVPNCD